MYDALLIIELNRGLFSTLTSLRSGNQGHKFYWSRITQLNAIQPMLQDRSLSLTLCAYAHLGSRPIQDYGVELDQTNNLQPK